MSYVCIPAAFVLKSLGFWLGAFENLRKATIKVRHVCPSTRLTLRPSVGMEQFGPRFLDFHEISFYVYGSVHRWSISITVQRDETQYRVFIVLQVHSTWISPLHRAVRKITSTINQQMHLYNFHLKKNLKYLNPFRHVSIFSGHHQGVSSPLAKVITYNIILKKYNLFTDMLPQHLVYKNELNREYVITLARNEENSWWWSEKIETSRSGFNCFKMF